MTFSQILHSYFHLSLSYMDFVSENHDRFLCGCFLSKMGDVTFLLIFVIKRHTFFVPVWSVSFCILSCFPIFLCHAFCMRSQQLLTCIFSQRQWILCSGEGFFLPLHSFSIFVTPPLFFVSHTLTYCYKCTGCVNNYSGTFCNQFGNNNFEFFQFSTAHSILVHVTQTSSLPLPHHSYVCVCTHRTYYVLRINLISRLI